MSIAWANFRNVLTVTNQFDSIQMRKVQAL